MKINKSIDFKKELYKEQQNKHIKAGENNNVRRD